MKTNKTHRAKATLETRENDVWRHSVSIQRGWPCFPWHHYTDSNRNRCRLTTVQLSTAFTQVFSQKKTTLPSPATWHSLAHYE